MKYAIVFLTLALVVCVLSKPTSNGGVDLTPADWDKAACEKVAETARKESKKCKDYQCIEQSYGLTVTGIDCVEGGS